MAVTASVTQNACQIPTTPNIRLNKNAVGIMINIYRQSEINKDGIPLPNPSNAPDEVTDTAETINPAPIILNAVSPAWRV